MSNHLKEGKHQLEEIDFNNTNNTNNTNHLLQNPYMETMNQGIQTFIKTYPGH